MTNIRMFTPPGEEPPAGISELTGLGGEGSYQGPRWMNETEMTARPSSGYAGTLSGFESHWIFLIIRCILTWNLLGLNRPTEATPKYL